MLCYFFFGFLQLVVQVNYFEVLEKNRDFIVNFCFFIKVYFFWSSSGRSSNYGRGGGFDNKS